MLLRQICCGWCGGFFCVCWSCWRGQAYCSDECIIAGRRRAHREAQRRYRQTQRGREAHREAECRRRKRLTKKIMDDRGSTPIFTGCKMQSSYMESTIRVRNFFERAGLGTKGHCHFCGSSGTIVDRFPRRGYSSSNYRAKMTQKMRC